MICVFVCINKEQKNVVNYPIYNGITFWHRLHGPIILGPCFWRFWFNRSKPSTARTKSYKQFNPCNLLLIMIESK